MRGEVAIGPSIYGVYVIDGSLCSRVYGIILQAVTTAGVEKMKQSFVVVMVWYALCCAGLAFCWIFPRGSVGFSPEVFVPLSVSSRVFTLGVWLCPTKCFACC